MGPLYLAVNRMDTVTGVITLINWSYGAHINGRKIRLVSLGFTPISGVVTLLINSLGGPLCR